MKVETYKSDLRKNISLRMSNTFRLDAVAPYMLVAHSTDDLSEFIRKLFSWDNFYMLGAGSNILVGPDVLNKPVVTLGGEFSYIERIDSLRLSIGAATSLSKVISYTIQENLKGFEELSGIPASIGGMAAVNASSFGKNISFLIEEATAVAPDGQIKHLNKNDMGFSYRYSSLKDYIIVGLTVKLEKAHGVKDRVSYYFKERLNRQDFDYPSTGCIFKNPPALSAGYLIDKCGLKGFRVGGAQVSSKHANFIINVSKAKSSDINYIIRVIKERVDKKFAISLEEEIVRWED